jgi:hypothetical protein
VSGTGVQIGGYFVLPVGGAVRQPTDISSSAAPLA